MQTFNCTHCGRSFPDTWSLFAHIFNVHWGRDFALSPFEALLKLRDYARYHFGDTETVLNEN